MSGSLKFPAVLLIAGFHICEAAEDLSTRKQEAHLHGHADMNIVIDGGDVFIELASPAINLLGFEHSPGTPEEIAILERVESLLLQYQSVIEFRGGNCSQLATASEVPVFSEGHDSSTEHDHEGEDGHAEFHLKYKLECSDNEIDDANVKAFMNFPGFQEINVQWVYGVKQGGAELTFANPVVQFNMP